MELLQLKYFCSAAETLNFSKTAQIFKVPQSAVSQSVKRLEKELGKELFLRRANKIFLNTNGEIFYKHISKGLEEFEIGLNEISERRGQPEGKISLLIKTNRHYVTDYIARFKALYPGAEFTIFHEYPEYGTNHFDLIIDDSYPKFGEYDKTLMVNEKINIGVSEEHSFANKKSIRVEELEGENFISMPRGSSLYRVFENLCYTAGIRPDIAIFCDDPYYVRKYTSMNLGITLIPEMSWKGLTDKLIVIPVSDLELGRNTYVFSRKNIEKNGIVMLFKEFLLECR